ncbi:MAG: hypothetical protein P4L53_17635 [Candidatus Obscuribacterales bacterium]|nr:hypothetical protein [Candidatus Obscuribacterales bacterium]
MSKKNERRLWLEAIFGFVAGLFLFIAWLFYADFTMSKFGLFVFPTDVPASNLGGVELAIFNANKFLIRTGWLKQGLLCGLIGAIAVVSCGYFYRLWRAATAKLY